MGEQFIHAERFDALAAHVPVQQVELTAGAHVIPASEYFAIPALSNSGMKSLHVSPLRYWCDFINPDREQSAEETAAMRIGSALHCAALEKDAEFDRRYACDVDPSTWPVCLDTISDLREWITGKGEKPKGTRMDEVVAQALALMQQRGEYVPILAEEKRRHFATNVGKTILSPAEWERVVGMTAVLRAEPALEPILAHGNAEVVLMAQDPDTGVWLKAKVDWLSPGYTLDLKTFSQQRGKSIDKSVYDAIFYERYWVQAYFYHYVRCLALSEKTGDFDTVFAFVESSAPHEVRLKAFRPTFAGQPMPYWQQARIEVKWRIRQYADYLQKYGSEPWLDQQSIEPITDEDIKQFAFMGSNGN
jgi:hypothetical protein